MQKRCMYLVGIDEAGRGPLAGPVAVGAVAVRSRHALRRFRGIRDSKKLTPRERERWFAKIFAAEQDGVLSCTVRFSSARLIDAHGIVQAIHAALKRALDRALRDFPHPLSEAPRHPAHGATPQQMVQDGVHGYDNVRIVLDGGLRAPASFRFQKTIVKGDEQEPLIAMASVAAKVLRDRRMIRSARKHPLYGFERHKGYGTREHYGAIQKYGVCNVHRRSFLKNAVPGDSPQIPLR